MLLINELERESGARNGFDAIFRRLSKREGVQCAYTSFMDTLVDHQTIIERCAVLGLSIDQVKHLAGKDHTLQDLAFMLALYPDTLSPVKPKRWLWMAAQTCSVSYRNVLTPERLGAALVSGVVAPEDEATFGHFLKEAPLPIVFMAAQQAAQQSGVSLSQIWRNLDQMALARSSARLRALAAIR